jgi:hypothetical protein
MRAYDSGYAKESSHLGYYALSKDKGLHRLRCVIVPYVRGHHGLLEIEDEGIVFEKFRNLK